MFQCNRNIKKEKSVCQQLIAPDSFCFLKVGSLPYYFRFLGGLAKDWRRIMPQIKNAFRKNASFLEKILFKERNFRMASNCFPFK